MTGPHYQDESVTLHNGDCLDVLRDMPDNSVDSVVTDPPYGLVFMGKAWDDHVDNRQFGKWCEQWAAECLRVLKPGGHMLAFGGTRTWHRLACAIEDAGFEVRDSIAWLYGSGFPKSLDVSKAIDKAAGVERTEGAREWSGGQRSARILGTNHGTQVRTIHDAPATPAAQQWQGWGTALKPAFEPVVVARKPLAGTVAANVLEWGCGAINVGACRVGSTGSSPHSSSSQTRARGCAVHSVHDLRDDRSTGAVPRSPAEVADDLRPEMHGEADERAPEPELAGRRLDGSADGIPLRGSGRTVGRGQGATAEATTARGPGAPSSNGAAVGASTGLRRDGAPPQRSQGRQPAGEPAPHGLGNALEGARPDRTGPVAATSGKRGAASCTCGGTESVAPAGRWPANVVLDESQAAALDAEVGTSRDGVAVQPNGGGQRIFNQGDGLTRDDQGYGGEGGPSRFFPTFRYQAKAPTRERPSYVKDGEGVGFLASSNKRCTKCGKQKANMPGSMCTCPEPDFQPEQTHAGKVAHPTVKPLELMRWLVRLVTPPGGVVLDPFAGSGTTVEAAILEGVRCIGIEREADYLPLIAARIERSQPQPDAPTAAAVEALTLFDEEPPA